jgi:hypothetical protein
MRLKTKELSMKINSKIFNLPPYISTSWNKISSLHMNGNNLLVTLFNGEVISIPNLPPTLVETIFACHAAFLEEEAAKKTSNPPDISRANHPLAQMMMGMEQGVESPFRFGFGTLDGMNSVLDHNPAQADSPEIPKEILQKIASIAKIVAGDENMPMPKAEPHCNCVHCQIARAVANGIQEAHPQWSSTQITEEPISEADLLFQEWDIKEIGPKIYSVAHRLDPAKKYQVYLGEPLGCTCGEPGCEHILAVLKS